MKIAQVSPLYESVPPRLYGGTERVVSFLTEELVRQGHEVTLFATQDSSTSARLEAVCPEGLRLQTTIRDCLAPHVLQLHKVMERAADFDIIHFHTEYLHFPLCEFLRTPHLTTLHGRLDLPEYTQLYRRFSNSPLVSISDSQRAPVPHADWLATIHHGLPKDLLPMGNGSGGYVAFLGRISPEKGVDRAIEIARRAGCPVRIAAKICESELAYYHETISRLFDLPGVEYCGEVGENEKSEFLGNAKAVLFPIEWPEPFGLVLIEALACGTPVIAYSHGSVPEIVQHGVTGFVVNGIDEAVHALENLDTIDRHSCRRAFEERFSASRMARDYVSVYQFLQERARARTVFLAASSVRPADGPRRTGGLSSSVAGPRAET